jgi:hypothetical protein
MLIQVAQRRASRGLGFEELVILSGMCWKLMFEFNSIVKRGIATFEDHDFAVLTANEASPFQVLDFGLSGRRRDSPIADSILSRHLLQTS